MQELIEKITTHSFHEADNKIYELLIKQYLPKEITQIEFVIQGIPRHYNITQISKIKKGFEAKYIEEDESKDLRTAFLFKQFDKDKSIIDVVKEKGYKLEIVKKAYDEYLELKGEIVVPKWFVDDLKEEEIRFERHYNPTYVFDDSEEGLRNITISFNTFVTNVVKGLI